MTWGPFLQPWGLLALAGIGAVVAIYLFYQRYRPQRVTGLFLWDPPSVTYRGGQRLERLHASRSLLLDLLAAILLGLAVAAPAILGQAGALRVVILDDSLSMRAGGNAARARALAADLVQGASDRVAVLVAGARLRVAAGPDAEMSDARRALETYDPYAPSAKLADAVGAARELYAGRLELHVITDHPLAAAAPAESALTVHTLAGRAGNLALLQAERYRADDGGERMRLAVANFSDAAATARIRVDAGMVTIHEEEAVLDGGAVAHLTVTPPADREELSIRLTGNPDALRADSEALLLGPPRREVRARIEGVPDAMAALVRRALVAAGATPTEGLADLLVTTDPEASGRVGTLQWVLPPEDASAFTGPFLVDATDPLCTDLDLPGIYWPAAEWPVADVPGVPLVSTRGTALFWRSGADRLTLNLDPLRSNITRNVAWPVLIANVVRTCRARLPGLRRRNYRTAQPLEFVPGPEAGLPDRLVGEGVEIPFRLGLPAPERPGVYRLVRGEEDVLVDRIAVHCFAAGESDLSGLAAADADETQFGAGESAAPEALLHLGWLLAILGCAAVAANWLLDRREAAAAPAGGSTV
ncbi:MAG: BatA domain-containing protein [Planctomycetota bacterium]